MEKQKQISVNALWRIRQARGLELKQVARLVGHRSGEGVSRYEKGDSHPNLQTVIKLMLVYDSNPKEMFPDLFEHCRREIKGNLEKYASSFWITDRVSLAEQINSCTYEEMLDSPKLTDTDKTIIRKHLTKLANRLAYL